MKEDLKNNLLEYLGQLMYYHENENDWIEKNIISIKINSINILFGINKIEKMAHEKIKL